jgi:hypothetical protein
MVTAVVLTAVVNLRVTDWGGGHALYIGAFNGYFPSQTLTVGECDSITVKIIPDIIQPFFQGLKPGCFRIGNATAGSCATEHLLYFIMTLAIFLQTLTDLVNRGTTVRLMRDHNAGRQQRLDDQNTGNN